MRPFQRDLSLSSEELDFEVGDPEHGMRLDSFLESRLRWCTRERARRWIAAGRCTVEAGRDPQSATIGRVRPSTRLRWGQRVVVVLDTPAARAAGDAGPVEIVWEDEHLIAVVKPSGVATHPTRRHLAGSLVERLHRQLAAVGRADRPSPCHRLDLETSGLLLLAKDAKARAAVGSMFESGAVDKTYLAVVRGIPAASQGRIDEPIGEDPASRVPVRRRVAAAGQAATTEWRRLRFGGEGSELEVRPATGRQHQIRVHLASIGHPILGDRLYLGGDEVFLRSLDGELSTEDIAALGHTRCALHARRLELAHPLTGEDLALEAPLAADLVELTAGFAPDGVEPAPPRGRRSAADDPAAE